MCPVYVDGPSPDVDFAYFHANFGGVDTAVTCAPKALPLEGGGLGGGEHHSKANDMLAFLKRTPHPPVRCTVDLPLKGGG